MEHARSEPATPRKLADARTRGKVAASPDLSAAASLLGLLAALLALGAPLLSAFEALLRVALRAAHSPSDPATAAALHAAATALLAPAVVLVVAPLLSAWLASFLQVGPLLAHRKIQPNFEHLDPAARLRQWFSPQRLLELAWTSLKLCALSAVAVYCCAQLARGLLAAPAAGARVALYTVSAASAQLVLRVALAIAIIGAIDLVYRRVVLARSLRMTRRELDDEHKDSHGAPASRAARARVLREAAAHGALIAAQDAQLLLLDSRGRALALAFDRDDPRQHAPRVVAHAQGALATRMHHAALLSEVPVQLDSALVAALFSLELGQEIPALAYPRVAALLAGSRSSSSAGTGTR